MQEDAKLIALLKESQRRQAKLLIVVLTVLVVLGLALMVLLPPGFRIGSPIALAGLGVLIGIVVTAPERRYLAKLGLTPQQAKDILRRAEVAESTRQESAEE